MDDLTRAPVADESLATLFSRVVADAEQVARSEIELQKTKLLAKVDEAKLGVVLVLLAVVLGSLALVGLVVGALMMLAPAVGPIWATVIVVGALIVAASLCGWIAMRQFKAMMGAKP